jgi:hypothetical protein
MIWGILAIIAMVVVGLFMMKAVKGTPFGKNCACAGNVEHMRWMEDTGVPPAGSCSYGPWTGSASGAPKENA